MALAPGVKDLKSLVQIAKDILVLEGMVLQTDIKFWKEPEYNIAREHDVRILVENALAPSDTRRAMVQSADESESLLIVSPEWRRRAWDPNSSPLQAYPFITNPKKRV